MEGQHDCGDVLGPGCRCSNNCSSLSVGFHEDDPSTPLSAEPIRRRRSPSRPIGPDRNRDTPPLRAARLDLNVTGQRDGRGSVDRRHGRFETPVKRDIEGNI